MQKIFQFYLNSRLKLFRNHKYNNILFFINHKISINNEKKRKTFLVNFFSIGAILSLTVFSIKGIIDGNILYSIYLLTFLIITVINLIFLKYYTKISFAAHTIIILMFIFGIIVFSFLGVGISGLFWFYAFPAITITLTNYKRGTVYSFIFVATTLIIYILKPNFLTNEYQAEIIFRFIASYLVLNILIVTFEYSRKKTQNELQKTLEKLKKTNKELSASEDELRASNVELFHINEKLSLNQKRLNLAQKVGGIGAWEWLVENDIISWTDTTYEIFGAKKTNKKLNRKDYFKFVHKDDKNRLIEELNISLKNNNKIHKTEYRIIRNNEVRHIEETSELIKTEHGKLIKMIGVLQDITQKKKVEKEIKNKNEELVSISEELKQNNEELQTAKEEVDSHYKLLKSTQKKYDLISNTINDFIWMLSLNLEPLYISSSCKKFIGYTKNELKNMNLSKFHTKKSLNIIKELLENTIKLINKPEKNKGIKTEIEYIHKNGNVIIAEVMGYLIFDENKNPFAIGGVSRDITKRKKTELALAESNKKIASAHKDILDNLKYAKTIQDGLLTNKEFIDNIFNDYFLIFKQRFSVGGDFYYVNRVNDYIVFSVGDCTGHGVSGGLLSMISITYLHEMIRADWIKTTGETLNHIRERFKRIFKDDNQSGFNIALCAVNTKTNVMQYSGAYHPLIIIRNGEFIEYKATRNPIGGYIIENDFKTEKIQLQKNDKLYIFSDGYYDQINSENKKIGIKQFKELLLKYSPLPFNEQNKKLNTFLINWKENEIQIDDITVLGINWEN